MPGWPREDHTDNCPCSARCDEAQTCVGRCNPNSIFYQPPKKTWSDHHREAIAAGMDDASACHAADAATN